MLAQKMKAGNANLWSYQATKLVAMQRPFTEVHQIFSRSNFSSTVLTQQSQQSAFVHSLSNDIKLSGAASRCLPGGLNI